MDRGAWWAAVHGVTKLDMTEQLSIAYICVCMYIWPYYMLSGPQFPPTRDQTCLPAVEAWHPNHWTSHLYTYFCQKSVYITLIYTL